MAPVGALLAGATAVYTAYLFAQSKARDLWQNPLLAPQMLGQAILAGAAAILPIAIPIGGRVLVALLWTISIGSAITLLFVFFETTMVHVTAHARLAVWEMTRGRYSGFFWLGVLGLLAGVSAPWFGLIPALAALAGLLLYEHAYVQSAQAVPIA
jgi:Ni/Fe-hydrogenase subunit HybB-like protein